MTLSILAFDQKTGTLAAAAATGSLCVGGWVLRGSLRGGLVASQGTAPSTLWRDAVLASMEGGVSAKTAIESITKADQGRAHRQIISLDTNGRTGAFTGSESIGWAGHVAGSNIVCAGNMIAGESVLTELSGTFSNVRGAFADKLLSALRAAEKAGGDSRGLQSAALLVIAPDAPPLDLRIDYHKSPLTALQDLLERVRKRPYADWLHEVPVTTDPMRGPSTFSEPNADENEPVSS